MRSHGWAAGEGVCLNVTDESAVQSYFASSGLFDHIAFTAGDWGRVRRAAFADIDLVAAAALFEVRFWGALAVAKHGAKCVNPGGSITLTNAMPVAPAGKGFGRCDGHGGRG